MARPTNRAIINKHISEGVSKLTPENIAKLEQVYSLDATIGEIASYLDVDPKTIYNWKNANPELFQKLERLREKPVLLARQTAIKKVNETYGNAMDYLSRKKKKEFSTKQEVEYSGSLSVSQLLDEAEKK